MSGICKGTVWGTEMEKSPVLTVYSWEHFCQNPGAGLPDSRCKSRKGKNLMSWIASWLYSWEHVCQKAGAGLPESKSRICQTPGVKVGEIKTWCHGSPPGFIVESMFARKQEQVCQTPGVKVGEIKTWCHGSPGGYIVESMFARLQAPDTQVVLSLKKQNIFFFQIKDVFFIIDNELFGYEGWAL